MNLDLIAVNGVGVDRIDLKQAKGRGIRLAATDNILTDAMADQAVALLGTTLRGQRASVIGLGLIGSAIAKRLRPFGVELAYHDRWALAGFGYDYHADPRNLAATSNTLLIAASGGPTLRHMVNAEAREALGANGVIANVARGRVIDADELVALLSDGRLGRAARDASWMNRVPEALLALNNAVLQPRPGSATLQTRRAMADHVVRVVLHTAPGVGRSSELTQMIWPSAAVGPRLCVRRASAGRLPIAGNRYTHRSLAAGASTFQESREESEHLDWCV